MKGEIIAENAVVGSLCEQVSHVVDTLVSFAVRIKLRVYCVLGRYIIELQCKLQLSHPHVSSCRCSKSGLFTMAAKLG